MLLKHVRGALIAQSLREKSKLESLITEKDKSMAELETKHGSNPNEKNGVDLEGTKL